MNPITWLKKENARNRSIVTIVKSKTKFKEVINMETKIMKTATRNNTESFSLKGKTGDMERLRNGERGAAVSHERNKFSVSEFSKTNIIIKNTIHISLSFQPTFN